MSRHDWLIAAPVGALILIGILVAAVMNTRASDGADETRRSISTPVATREGMVWVTLDIGAALGRSQGDWEDGFAVELRDDDVVARSDAVRVGRDEGPGVLEVWAEQESYSRLNEPTVKVTFEMRWPEARPTQPDAPYPIVLDDERYPFTSWTEASGCNALPGRTSVSVAIDPEVVGLVTFVLGPSGLAEPC